MIGRTDPSMFFAPVTGLCQLLLVVRRAGDGGDVAALTAIIRDAAYKKIRHTFQFIYLHRRLYILFLFHIS